VQGIQTCHPATLQPGGLSSSLGDRAMATGGDFVCVYVLMHVIVCVIGNLIQNAPPFIPLSSSSASFIQCSQSCGGGVQVRKVYCQQLLSTGAQRRLGDGPCWGGNLPLTGTAATLTVCPICQKENGER